VVCQTIERAAGMVGGALSGKKIVNKIYLCTQNLLTLKS